MGSPIDDWDVGDVGAAAPSPRTIPVTGLDGEVLTLPPDAIVSFPPDKVVSFPPDEIVSFPPDEVMSCAPSRIEGSEEVDRSDDVPAKVVDDTCGRYQLCFELASGGMASVFLAAQRGDGGVDRLVALKRLQPHLEQDSQFLTMFLDEARVASQLTHPNVCGVTDFGCAEGRHFLVMEYLVGESLAHVQKRLRGDARLLARSLPLILRIIADAAEGLHAAHELGDNQGNLLHVVHRDVGPQNLFVAYDGNTKVVDFGIAKARGRLTHTVTGVLKGHVEYMAPEQFLRGGIDRRADVWALGVVLWELVTGTSLFRSSPNVADTVRAILSDSVRRPSDVRPEVPADLDPIVMRCLATAPDERYPTARAMGKEIHRFLHRHYDEPTGVAEVSEWMHTTFAHERAGKGRLVRAAQRALRVGAKSTIGA